MKTLSILLLTLLLSNVLVATELDWVDEQIEAIKPPRKGVVVAGVTNPFVFLDKNKPKDAKKGVNAPAAAPATAQKTTTVGSDKEKEAPKPESFVLNAIINSSAMINGNWYRLNDKVSSYIISEIDKDFVTLKNKKGDKTILLSTLTKNKTLKFKNK